MPPALLAAHYKDRIKGAKRIIGDPRKRKPYERMQGREQRDIERADATVRGGLARRETCADATVCAGTCGDIEQMTNNVRCGRACKTWIYRSVMVTAGVQGWRGCEDRQAGKRGDGVDGVCGSSRRNVARHTSGRASKQARRGRRVHSVGHEGLRVVQSSRRKSQSMATSGLRFEHQPRPNARLHASRQRASGSPR